MTDKESHWLSSPMGPSDAAQRARQLEALTNPDRLRLLSATAAQFFGSVTPAVLASELEMDRAHVNRHLQVLRSAGLITEADGEPGNFVPSAEALIRFGRLLLPATSATETYRPATSALGPEVPRVVHRIADRLAYRFSSTFSSETVHQYVGETYQLLAQRARVSQHLPSLTARFATDRLAALAVANGHQRGGAPEVLFVCVRNAGRSQIAAALLRQMAGEQVHIRTAGSRPSNRVDPVVVQVLDEVGVPVVSEFPKPLTDEVVQASDYVVTMGCGDACPLLPGRRYLDWPIPDPANEPVTVVRRIRDLVAERVQRLCTEMHVAVAPL